MGLFLLVKGQSYCIAVKLYYNLTQIHLSIRNESVIDTNMNRLHDMLSSLKIIQTIQIKRKYDPDYSRYRFTYSEDKHSFDVLYGTCQNYEILKFIDIQINLKNICDYFVNINVLSM